MRRAGVVVERNTWLWEGRGGAEFSTGDPAITPQLADDSSTAGVMFFSYTYIAGG